MPGAPNCQYPPWTDAEKEIVGRAWDIPEALRTYGIRMWMGMFTDRTYKAIASEWYRQHPLLHSRLEPVWEAYFAVALDELEALA